MYDVMAGIKVVEVAEHTFVPAAGMILADWGADVIKIEKAQGGDASRHLKIPGIGKVNPFFETANRGKRSVALDLTRTSGREQLYRLIDSADVFVTNLRADARAKLGIETDDVIKRNSSIIYARGTGYGLRGDMSNDGGFDYPSAWCRAGAGYQQTKAGGQPPGQPGSIGDLCGGAALAGAISAALFRRERTGKGAIVDNALYLMGAYFMSQSLVAASAGLPLPQVRSQQQSYTPLLNNYRTSDYRWINICLLVDAWWPDFLQHIEREELLEDARFADAKGRAENASELIDILNETFASRDYAQWCDRLKTMKGVWSPLQSPQEVLADPQALDNGFVSRVGGDEDGSYLVGVSPAQFDEQLIGDLKRSPDFGEHTDEILCEAGLDEESITNLRKQGAIR